MFLRIAEAIPPVYVHPLQKEIANLLNDTEQNGWRGYVSKVYFGDMPANTAFAEARRTAGHCGGLAGPAEVSEGTALPVSPLGRGGLMPPLFLWANGRPAWSQTVPCSFVLSPLFHSRSLEF